MRALCVLAAILAEVDISGASGTATETDCDSVSWWNTALEDDPIEMEEVVAKVKGNPHCFL